MSRKILVVGVQVFDAGKTTLCKALIHGFRNKGIMLVPFKPHSGIGYWTQFDAFQESLGRGSLLSSDIIELEKAAGSQIPLEVLNPINRLSTPVLDRGVVEEKLVFQEFIAERFSFYDGVVPKNIYYLNGTLNLRQLRDMESFFLKVKRNAEKTYFARKYEDLEEAYTKYFEKATSTCYNQIQDRDLVVESFNDAAYPFSKSEECDSVLCTSSNLILTLDNRKYFEAIKTKNKEKPALNLTVPEIFDASMIKNKILIQPLTVEERKNPEKLVRNYSLIINELLND